MFPIYDINDGCHMRNIGSHLAAAVDMLRVVLHIKEGKDAEKCIALDASNLLAYLLAPFFLPGEPFLVLEVHL